MNMCLVLIFCLFNLGNLFAVKPHQLTKFDIVQINLELEQVLAYPIGTIDFDHKGINAPVQDANGNETLDNALTALCKWSYKPEEDLLPVVKLLLSYGINVNHKTYDKETALFLACCKRPPSPLIITALIDHRANPHSQNRYGRTPFQVIEQHMKLNTKHRNTYQYIVTILNEAPEPKPHSI